MAADQVADVVDQHLAVKLRKARLDEIGHGAGVFVTGGHGDKALAGIVGAALGALLHLLDDLADDLFLRADLKARDQPPEIVHVHQRADLQNAAEHARGLGDAAALDKEGQVGGEEPVVDLQPVFLDPGGHFVHAEPLIPLGGGGVHQQAVARGGAQRVNDVDLPLRVALGEDVGGVAGGVDGAGNAGGEANVHDVLPLLQERHKGVHILGHADLGGLGVRALAHAVIELLKGDGLAQIVRVLHPVQGIVEADIVDMDLFKVLLAQIGGGAAAEDIAHGEGSFPVFPAYRIPPFAARRNLSPPLPALQNGSAPGFYSTGGAPLALQIVESQVFQGFALSVSCFSLCGAALFFGRFCTWKLRKTSTSAITRIRKICQGLWLMKSR